MPYVRCSFLTSSLAVTQSWQQHCRLLPFYFFSVAVSMMCPGLSSSITGVPQATNFCLGVTRKTFFLHKASSAQGHPRFHGREPLGSL